jgi:hypothetical protein
MSNCTTDDEDDTAAATNAVTRNRMCSRLGILEGTILGRNLQWDGRRNDFVLARFGLGDCPPLAQLCWKHVLGP